MKGFLFILLALVLAASAGGIAYIYLVNASTAAREVTLDTEQVVVASKDITFGTELGDDHVRLADFPRGSIPFGAYTQVDSVLGQTTKVFLVAGEPVLASKLSTAGGGLSVRIPESMRASSVKVNMVSGVSGFILPGDRVDVLVTIANLGKAGNSVTKTILQDSEVLAAGVKTETKKDNPVKVQSVTLLVDPKGAADLALAISQGAIHLVLRNPADHEIAQVGPTNTQEVMGGATKPRRVRRAKPAPPAKVVEAPPPVETTYTIIRDGTVKEEKFPNETTKTAPEKK